MKLLSCHVLKSDDRKSYHQKVIEEEDLSLVHSRPLRSIGVRNLVKLAATHQPAMGEGQHLYRQTHYKQVNLQLVTTYYKATYAALLNYKTNRLLAHNDSLHCLHLGHMVIIGP